MPEVSKATLKTYFEDGKEPDENKYIDLVDTLWEQGGGVSDHGDLTGLADDDHPQYLLVGAVDHGDLTGLADDDHPQYLLADGSRIVSGDFTVGDGTGSRTIFVDGAAGSNRNVTWRTAGVNRWILRTDTDAEGGANAGSNWELSARKDDGTWLSNPIKVIRSTGEATFSKDLTIGEGTGAKAIIVDGAAGNYRGLYLRTAGENRFAIVLGTVAESGSAAGSDLNIWRYDDDEVATLDFAIDRSTGDIYQYKDIRIGGGLYVGGTSNPPLQGIIQSVSDIRAGGGLVVGSTSPNPASGYGVMGGGLSIGSLTPPYEARANLFLDYTGGGSYGFINSVSNLHIYQNQYYDGAWKAIGTGKVGGFQTSMSSGIPFQVSASQASYTAEQGTTLYANFKVTNYSELYMYIASTNTLGAVLNVDASWLRLTPQGGQNIYCGSGTGLRADGGLSATSSVNPLDGVVVAQQLRVYEGGTQIGGFLASDTTWLRINQNVAKNIYSPRTITMAGGLMTGTSALPGAGGVGYTVSLRPYKNSSFYTTYSFHAYATKKTSGSFNGDPKSTTGATKIDLSAVFGVPSGVKAVSVRIYARDSGGHILTGQYLGVGPSSADPFAVTVRPVGNDQISENTGITTCDGNGDIYWRCGASGGGTLDIWIEISGYFI